MERVHSPNSGEDSINQFFSYAIVGLIRFYRASVVALGFVREVRIFRHGTPLANFRNFKLLRYRYPYIILALVKCTRRTYRPIHTFTYIEDTVPSTIVTSLTLYWTLFLRVSMFTTQAALLRSQWVDNVVVSLFLCFANTEVRHWTFWPCLRLRCLNFG